MGEEVRFLTEEIDSLNEELDACDHDLKMIQNQNEQLGQSNKSLVDFINRISGEMLRNDCVLDEKWYEQAQQLIKSATQLNP